jgi:hypothetical protein
MWPGVKLGWVPIALVMLAHVPGRHVFADNEAMHGRPGWQFLWAGLSGDLLYVGPPVLLAFIVPLVIGAAVERKRPRAAPALVGFFTTALAAALLVSAWMFSVGAIESKLERGLYPTYLETKVALGSSSFVIGSLPTLLLDRYRYTSALVLLVSAALLYFHGRRARTDLRSLPGVTGFAVTGLLLFGVDCEVVKLGRVVFPRTGSYAETRSPIETVALGRFPFPNHTPITDGMRLVFASHEYPPDQKLAGLRALGFPPSSAERLIAFEGNEPCTSPHPLARPFERERGSQADALLDDLDALSSALFAGRDEPVVVWQIAMESFRADDIHALHPEAPAELTPVMTRLYDDRAHVIGFRGAFQGGFRTAQGLSSLHCGIGSLPFNIATARDMGHFPLRCLPDVLSDGGFDTRAFYASDMAYDSMLEFFRYHGVEGTQAADMPPGLPIGSWRGVSDRALYDQALAHASASSSRSLYEFVLTLSGHSPFSIPTDMPPEVTARVASACRKSAFAREDDCSRLAVISYADYALGELLEKLDRSPSLRSRSVVIVSADHATSEMFLWPGSAEQKVRAHVPYLMIVPEGMRAAAPRPELAGQLVEQLHDRASTQVISLMDSPTLVTSLLSSTRELRSIPAPWRFHTYGGQATSPHFAFDARPGARIWGTDSAAFVFSADPDASVTAYENKNRAFSGAAELETINPSLRGPAAFLASFAKGYLGRCENQARLRMNRSTTATR